MPLINHFSQEISVFHGRSAPETGTLVGYGAIIDAYGLSMPMPEKLTLISKKNRQYSNQSWLILGPRYLPEDSLYKQLAFAIRYEGINLLFFKKLFQVLETPELIKLLEIEPIGQYSRKIWFLYEWLTGNELPIPSLSSGNYVPLIDEKVQYAIEGIRIQRQRIVNNLPGTRDFCPLIFKTQILQKYVGEQLDKKKNLYVDNIHKDVLQRASAFLMLKDSKASFTIEGETPGTNRAMRWGKAIGQAGMKPLTKEELIRLQQIIIESKRFTKMGFRKEGGFVGEHDRNTGEPIPDHISAKWEDAELLIDSLIDTATLLEESEYDAVLTAAIIAFGFVFIHPFTDGNGRLHRYLIHHILAQKEFAHQGIIFPISAAILNRIDEYRKVLEKHSLPLLDFIDWESTDDHNVKVNNETIDFYKYFDATPQAEFLYSCVEETIEHIIPEEVDYLNRFDQMKGYLENKFEMPDKLIAMIIRFLEQNNGKLSKRAKMKEFSVLTDLEVLEIENRYEEIMLA